MDGAAFVDCLLEPAQEQAPRPDSPYQEWVFPNGRRWTQFYRAEDGYLLRFPELADFLVSIDGAQACCRPVPGVSEATWQHLYLNQVRPLMLGKRGELVFHGSAVEVGGGAVAFLAAAGRGKSTLAAAFATAGGRFLTDDGLLLRPEGEGYRVVPDHPSIRLWSDSRQALVGTDAEVAAAVSFTPKMRLPAQGRLPYCTEPRRLLAAYFLGEGGAAEVTFSRVTGGAALSRWVEHAFLLDLEDRQLLRDQFEAGAALAGSVACFDLDYLRRFEELDRVCARITAHATALEHCA